MKYIVSFNEIRKGDIALAGGKGANLGELIRLGVEVPRGVVLTSLAYDLFIKENEIELDKIFADVDDEKTALETIRESIRRGEVSELIKEEIAEFYDALGEMARVAVRSSATAEDLEDASFAGQQESFLNVIGIDEIEGKIKNCYASLWGDRAFSYRKKQGYNDMKVSIAVVLQEMVESESAGVIFTKNPSTEADEVLINASYGLGESVVSGIVSPDEYICFRDGSVKNAIVGSKEVEIVYSDSGTKQVKVDEKRRDTTVLDYDMIKKLVLEAVKIEEHYGVPMDIEWAIKDGEIFILQARMITTKNEEFKVFAEEDFKGLVKAKPASKIMRENLLFNLEKIPTPYFPLDHDFSNLIGEQKEKLFLDMGIKTRQTNDINDDGISIFNFGGTRPTLRFLSGVKIAVKMKDREYNIAMSKREYERCEERFALEKSNKYESLEDIAEALSRMRDLISDTAYSRFRYAVFPLVIESKGLERKIKKLGSDYNSFDLLDGYSYLTTNINRDMNAIASEIIKDENLKNAVLEFSYEELISSFPEVRNLFEKFFTDYAYRSDYNCYCFTAKSWVEDPERFLSTLRVAVKSAKKQGEELSENKYEKIMREIRIKLSSSAFETFKKKVLAFRHYYYIREASQYLWESEFAHCRRLLRKVSEILQISYQDLLYLFADELFELLKLGKVDKKYLDLIEKRKSKRPLAEAYWDYNIELMLKTDSDIIEGVSGSAGRAKGKVCVVKSPEEFYKLKEGDVLVCPLTDPEWTVLFSLASAVVVDTGGSLSHAAIVAREYKIPAVLATGNATKVLKDGDMVIVDGSLGKVSLI